MPCKSRERAREKAVTCYRSDVSRLLDVCRQRIVFSNVTALRNGLDRIATDRTVRLVRAAYGPATLCAYARPTRCPVLRMVCHVIGACAQCDAARVRRA
eukprot:400729-Rhodomonas_salina.7